MGSTSCRRCSRRVQRVRRAGGAGAAAPRPVPHGIRRPHLARKPRLAASEKSLRCERHRRRVTAVRSRRPDSPLRPTPERSRRRKGPFTRTSPDSTLTWNCRARVDFGSHQDWPVRISNSQPCQGQRRNSPGAPAGSGRVRRIAPVAMILPWHSGPPSCGQRLASAKYSPFEIEHADLAAVHIDDLAMARRDFDGAGNDLTLHGRPYNALALSRNTLAFCASVSRELEGVLRIVEVPVRVVGREHQPVPAEPFDDCRPDAADCPAPRSAAW